jgi:hypothetical protein
VTRRRLSLFLLIVLGACAGGREPTPAPQQAAQSATPVPTAEPSPSPSAVPDDPPPPPKPHAGLPHRPRAIARDITSQTLLLRDDISKWLADGRPGDHRRLRPLLLRGLYQQRLFRYLTKHDRTARRTIGKIDRSLRAFARTTVTVGAALRALVTPVKGRIKFKTHKPAPAGKLLSFYKKAQRKSDIDWHVMASLNFVESKFGRVLGPSSAGARGPMQFLPSTWEKYGNGGDIDDPHDSILAAARYLEAWGAPGNMHDALYAYNHSDVYVRAVQAYARMMRRNELNYYDYYFWQVFVITTRGDKQLTGPGTDR